ncbi:MAG: radical SAM protein [Elusimicrobiota bacterium]
MPARLLEPNYIALDLTYRCPLSCDFCFMSRSGCRGTSRRELRLPALKKLVDALSGKPREFWICGGEPALRPDLPELVACIKARGHRCFVTSGGWPMKKETALRLLEAGIDEIVFSLHGTPAVHDRVVGAKGAFARTAALCAAVNASPLKGNTRLSVWCTIHPRNHRNLHAAYKAFKALRPDHIAFNHLEYVRSRDIAAVRDLFRRELGCGTAVKASEELARGMDVARLLREMARIRAERDPSVRFELDLTPAEIRAWYDPAAEVPKKGFCLGQWNCLWVVPDGTLVSCQPLGHRLGRLRGGDYRRAFNGPAYRRFRALLMRQGGFLGVCSRCGRSSHSSEHYERTQGAQARRPRA